MVQSCVVVGCTNRWEKGSRLSWHRIPSKNDQERRNNWLSSINRKNWQPNNQDRVCGNHFLSGCASHNKDDPDYVPTLNMGYELMTTSTPVVKVGRYERATSRRRKRLAMELDENERRSAASTLLDLSTHCDADIENSPPGDSNNDTDVFHIKKELENCRLQLAETRLNERLLINELGRLQEENSSLRTEVQSSFGISFLQEDRSVSDKRTSFYTGVPNLATLLWIVSFVQSALPDFSSLNSQADAVIIVLMKFKLNLQNFDLAIRFRISESTVSNVLNRTIPILAEKLKFLIHWPDKEDVLRTLPQVFKPKYRNARTIIDCTEIFIERPGNLTARAATWSNYKHHNTLKYLVAITPLGSISFVSKAFGGRTSDKVVTLRSGFLDLLEYGDLVLADRGFLIGEEIAARNCFLSIPAFTRGQAQLTQQQVETSRSIARVRIHVERAIGRLKNFKILSTQMSLSMVPHSDSVLTICAAICNFQSKLVK
ncbi:uncharacterized protein LOC127881097 [Dreissena polymorpha]|uniref:uncharacterized protein LOC127881097 n=1 Tax=Dreissena polymorpha TaxID=45954 RepID=UPI0022640FA4|nr:uncharacterized protein LOC127881097 [Dreissena polymorpha]